jgi:ribulose-phosphate 3-epimerase
MNRGLTLSRALLQASPDSCGTTTFAFDAAHRIAPSLLSADFADLNSAVRLVDESPAPWLHIDVMDGVFVPNISFGLPVIKAIRPFTKKVFDVHLMIVRPDPYINPFRDVGADNLTVHLEACTHLHRTVQAIKAAGMKAGVAINPHTSVEALGGCACRHRSGVPDEREPRFRWAALH